MHGMGVELPGAGSRNPTHFHMTVPYPDTRYTIRKARMSLFRCFVLLLSLTGRVWSDSPRPTIHERIYQDINATIPCFRLINATHQIGCSASSTYTRGVVQYVNSSETLLQLVDNGSHSPYIILLEPHLLTKDNTLRLKSSSRISGVLVRFRNETNSTTSTIPEGPDIVSPEERCPNAPFAYGRSCQIEWNREGNALSFQDFGDFPIIALPTSAFEKVLDCFNRDNADGDFPLCSAEITADMKAVKDTPTCYRREKLLTMQTTGTSLCEPLGDSNVWGTLFDVRNKSDNQGNYSGNDIIMLTTKLDSSAFFPYLAFGANNELAGIATLLAVVEALGKLKKEGQLIGTARPVMYTFFHGESWDYIGSSRMVYDMANGDFPYAKDDDKDEELLPKVRQANIGDYLELSQLGIQGNQERPTFYLHSITPSNIITVLNAIAEDSDLIRVVSSNYSAICDRSSPSSCILPPASLHSFLKKDESFMGTVLADFDRVFNSKWFGSRYDTQDNLAGGTPVYNETIYENTIQYLTDLATVLTNTLLNISGPVWNDTAFEPPTWVNASSDTIRNLLSCFLIDSTCPLFQSVLAQDLARTLSPVPLPRYVTVSRITNPETQLIFQLLASFTATKNTTLSCSDCLARIHTTDKIQAFNWTWVQVTGTSDQCYCIQSYTYMHKAESPAFDLKDYGSRMYSTWAESIWTVISLRIYLVTYTAQEVGFLFCGLAMILITVLVAIQCQRKGKKIFAAKVDSGSNN